MSTLVIGVGVGALAGCLRAEADATPPTGNKAVAVTVSISSATLADDCGAPPAGPGAAVQSKAASDQTGVRMARRACRQTSVQLGLASGSDGAPSTFAIVKAQLFDAATGKLVQEMATRNPQVWAASGRFQSWDRVVKANQKLQVSYDMNAPDWSKMGGSQMAAQGKSFRLVMTVRVGGKQTTIESTVQSAELMMEPNVVT
ncbi:MAG: hypothetical protein EXR72_08915 [Myxococcales bacterium]|nr:hypothetical protein [Myxococcales bacterium]